MKCTEGVISAAQKGISKRRAKPPTPTGTGVFIIAGGQDMNPGADAQHDSSLKRCRERQMGKVALEEGKQPSIQQNPCKFQGGDVLKLPRKSTQEPFPPTYREAMEI